MSKKIFILIITVACISGCKKQDFVDANIDPSVAYTISPENQFLNGSKALFSNDFEAYYEVYRNIMPWVQLNTPLNGNLRNFTENTNPFSRYDNLFGRGGGSALYDVNVLIDKMESPQKETYAQLSAIARILLDYEYFYVSDVYGSIAYSDAFKGRYSLEFTVPYNTQQDVFNGIDTDLKNAIQQIKSAPSGQFTLGNFDQFFYGDATKWVKAANALRLRLAMRLMKQDESKSTAIINEVLSNPASDLMGSNDDSWSFKATSSLASGGNWSPDQLKGTKALIDFMLNTNDPRLRIFYAKNSYSLENFNIAKDTGFISPSATFIDQRYVGSFANPDSSSSDAIQARYYTRPTITKGGSSLVLDTVSNINQRLFQTAFNGGTGLQYFPLITFADFNFMRAEIAARGIGSDNPGELYTSAVTASIMYYGKMATDGKILDYYAEPGGVEVSAPTDVEINAYLTNPSVVYDPAKGLDLIASQSFINFFKEANEAWALLKRTGLPNSSTTLKLEDLYYNGTLLTIPRRAPRSLPNTGDINFDNANAAFTEMQANPDYGSGPGDIKGRVWWDKK